MKKIIALLMALVMVFAFAACGKEAAPAPTEAPAEPVVEESTEPVAEETATVMSYEEYAAAELDTEVTVETYVQAKQSWWEDKATVYTQDENGGYFLYDMACSQEDYEKLVPGTKIRVTGFKSEWSGEVEIIDATFEIIEGSFIAEPVDATALLGKDELISLQNQKVAFKGVTVKAANDAGDAYLYKWDGSGQDGDDLYFTISLDGAAYSFTVESYLCDNTTDVYAAVKNLKVGDKIDVEGFMYWYEGPQAHVTAVVPAA